MSAQSLGTLTGTISGQFRDSNLGVLGKRTIWMSPPRSVAENTIWGKVVASLSPGHGESCVLKCPWLVPTPKGVPKCELTLLWLVLDADASLIF